MVLPSSLSKCINAPQSFSTLSTLICTALWNTRRQEIMSPCNLKEKNGKVFECMLSIQPSHFYNRLNLIPTLKNLLQAHGHHCFWRKVSKYIKCHYLEFFQINHQTCISRILLTISTGSKAVSEAFELQSAFQFRANAGKLLDVSR